MKKHKIGIIGGAGYTAGELIRIVLQHPNIEIGFIHSHSNYGKHIHEVHKDLFGETNLKFSKINYHTIDLIFICSGHGKSKIFIENSDLPKDIKIIDLSSDFRLKPENKDFVYGLTELNRDKIKQALHIANPGCFATAIELGILPLAQAYKIESDIHINAITGSTGAGQKPTETTHFSWKNNNISIYKPFIHQHLHEIKQTIESFSNFNYDLNFIPVRGNFSRGIMASIYLNCHLNIEDIKTIYTNFYKNSNFVFISNTIPDVKQVVNSNKCILYLTKYNNKLLIISAIDNLLKGASGQAVQNMNLMFGLNENTGLQLKTVGF